MRDTDLASLYKRSSPEYEFFPTSKMSHDRGRRAVCGVTIWSLGFHFDRSYDSTRRDGHGRWLWRLVRPFFPLGNQATHGFQIVDGRVSDLLSSLHRPRGQQKGHERVRGICDRDSTSSIHYGSLSSTRGVLPNVKDEPRPWLARRVRHDDLESEVSFGDS